MSSVLQPDGRIVISGSQRNGFYATDTYDFLLARYNVNGDLDSTFINGGIVATNLNSNFEEYSNDLAYKILLQPDGKIVAAGISFKFYYPGRADACVEIVRYQPDGSIDETFGHNGQATFRIGHGFSNYIEGNEVLDAVLSPDGKILIGTAQRFYKSGESAEFEFIVNVLRCNPDGSLDTSFADDGIYSFPIAYSTGFNQLYLLPDGKIFVLFSNGRLRRLFSDGTLDTSFGVNGELRLVFNSYGYRILLDGDGHFILAGHRYLSQSEWRAFLSRFDLDGSLDTTFGSAGTSELQIAQPRSFFAHLDLDSSGRIITSGAATDGSFSPSLPLVARFLNHSSPKPVARVPRPKRNADPLERNIHR